MPSTDTSATKRSYGRARDALFWGGMLTFGLLYVTLIFAMIVADLRFASWSDIAAAFRDQKLRFSVGLSMVTCTISAILSMWVAVPTGYLLARSSNEELKKRLAKHSYLRRIAVIGRQVIETLIDVPIVLPPLVVGISLLVLFQTPPGRWLDHQMATLMSAFGFPGVRGITYEVPAVILAQFTVAAAFAVRVMRTTFEEIDPEPERVALTQGANDAQAFWQVAVPQAWRGMVAAITLAWARSLGEFGPILIFAGTSRMKTEVLSTTVYLNFSIGNLRGAITASLILVFLAAVVLLVTRWTALGGDQTRVG